MRYYTPGVWQDVTWYDAAMCSRLCWQVLSALDRMCPADQSHRRAAQELQLLIDVKIEPLVPRLCARNATSAHTGQHLNQLCLPFAHPTFLFDPSWFAVNVHPPNGGRRTCNWHVSFKRKCHSAVKSTSLCLGSLQQLGLPDLGLNC